MSIEILSGILKKIGNFKMAMLEDRIVFQKTIYFLQTFGLNLGYNFNWYIFGPYSPELAKDGFEIVEKRISLGTVEITDENQQKRFDALLEFLGDKKNDFRWLELLASIHFLRKLYPKVGKEEIKKQVMTKQPYFNDEKLFESGWEYLKKHSLLCD